MRKDKIVKAMMSAMVMVSMTAVSSQAESYGAGEAGRTETKGEALETGSEEQEQCSSGSVPEESPSHEAEYEPHRVFNEGPGVVEWKTEETEETAEYGPHVLQEQETETEMETEQAVQSYTDEELYILAHAICGEGQCCPDEEQLYIGSVILNRKNHGAYPDTIEGVVFQKGQYACTWDGNYYREPTEVNWRNARWLLENGSILPGNVVYQAGFRQGSGLYLQTRYHKYCYR